MDSNNEENGGRIPDLLTTNPYLLECVIFKCTAALTQENFYDINIRTVNHYIKLWNP